MKKLLIVILTMMMILFFIACTPAGPFTLTVNITGTGTVTLNPIGGTYEAGTVLTLTATPDSNYTFTGWSGDLSGSTNPTTITMDSNKTVSVSFIEKSFPNEWLILMYQDGDVNISSLLWKDVNEMEKGLYNLQQADSNLYDKVKVVVLWDGSSSNDSKLYELGPEASENTTISSNTIDLTSTASWISGEVNMGSGTTVTNYLDWAMTNYTDYAHVIFILSDHGGGPGKGPITKAICWDDHSGDDYLSTDELAQAIADAGFSTTNKLAILGMDACLMGSTEEAYQYRDVAEYFVASPQSEQGDGWEYGDGNSSSGYGWIDHIVNDMSASELSIVMAQSYKSNFSGDQTMSAIDLSLIEELKTAIDDLGTAINSAGSSARSAAKTVMNNAYTYDSWNFPYIKDFGDFCIKLANSTNSNITSAIKDAATTAGSALGNAVLWAYGPSYSGIGTSHKKGLSIVGSYQSFYSTLDFNGGGWSTLLNAW